MWKYSFGDICKSRYWLSFERKPWAMWRWWIGFQPTYNGTIRGLHIGLPFMTILGHIRDTRLNAVETPTTYLITLKGLEGPV